MTNLFNKTFYKLIQEAKLGDFNPENYKERITFLKEYYSYELTLAEQELQQTDNLNEINEISKKIIKFKKLIRNIDELFLMLEELIELSNTTKTSIARTTEFKRFYSLLSRTENPEMYAMGAKKYYHKKKENKEEEKRLKNNERNRRDILKFSNTGDKSNAYKIYDADDLERLHKRFLEIKQEYPSIINNDIYKIIAKEENRSTIGIKRIFDRRIFKED